MMHYTPILLVIAVASVYGQYDFGGGLTHDYPDGVRLTVGDQLELSCGTSDALPEGIVWKHNGMPLSGERFAATLHVNTDESSVTTMTLSDITTEDAGQYECSNPADYFDKATISVSVLTPPDEPTVHISQPPEEVTHFRPTDEELTLMCEAPLSVRFTWMSNDEEVIGAEGIRLTTVYNVTSNLQETWLVISTSHLGFLNEFTCQDVNYPTNKDTIQLLQDETSLEEAEDTQEEAEDTQEEAEDSQEEAEDSGECRADALEEELAGLRSRIRELCEMLPDQ